MLISAGIHKCGKFFKNDSGSVKMFGGSTIVFFCWAFYFQHLTSLP
jgi:hypothetical protein